MYVSIPKKTDRFDASSTLSQCFVTASRQADLAPLKPVQGLSALSGNTILSTREAAH